MLEISVRLVVAEYERNEKSVDHLKMGWTAPKIVPLTAAGASEGGIFKDLCESSKVISGQNKIMGYGTARAGCS